MEHCRRLGFERAVPAGCAAEQALRLWLTAICATARARYPQFAHLLEVKDVCRDLCDGQVLGLLVSHYWPEALAPTDLALSEGPGIADSLHNLQSILHFADTVLPVKVCHMSLNDLFHSHDQLRTNLVAMLADFFVLFEVNRQLGEGQSTGSRPSSGTTKLMTSPVISNATKKSFNQETNDDSSQQVNLPPARHPLLPKRVLQKETNSPTNGNSGSGGGEPDMTSHKNDTIKLTSESKESQFTNVTPRESGDLLSVVSMDSDVSLDLSSAVDIDSSRESSARSPHLQRVQAATRGPPKANHDDLELESVRSHEERLQPARLREAKEKVTSPSKAVESGERLPRRSPGSPAKVGEFLSQGHGSPSHPASPKKSPKHHRAKPHDLVLAPARDSSSSDDDFQTPSGEAAPFTIPAQPEARENQRQPEARENQRQPEAFYVDTDDVMRTRGVRSVTSVFDRSKPNSQSFTMHNSDKMHSDPESPLPDEPSTPEEARAKGIPVVGDVPAQVRELRSRSPRDEGARTASPRRGILVRRDRSSSESSDQELRKLSADRRAKESDSFYLREEPTEGEPASHPRDDSAHRPDSLSVPRPIRLGNGPMRLGNGPLEQAGVGKTSFAEMKQMSHVLVDNSLLVTHAQEDLDHDPRDTFRGHTMPRVQKKTSFAALPNQTTWQETARKVALEERSTQPQSDATALTSRSDIMDIRVRLEERRRQIENEKKRLEASWNRQRQRVGKQAFLQVINKGPAVSEKGVRERSSSSHNVRAREGSPTRAADMTRRSSSGEGDRAQLAAREKDFSIDDVHDKISSVRKRWFPAGANDASAANSQLARNSSPARNSDESVVTSRMSNSWEGRASKSPAPSQSRMTASEHVARSTAPVVAPPITTSSYNSNSLDKLNSSLTELQGEIMRLSLQQEQIKTMATEKQEEKKKPNNDAFYLYPGGAAAPGPESRVAPPMTFQSPPQGYMAVTPPGYHHPYPAGQFLPPAPMQPIPMQYTAAPIAAAAAGSYPGAVAFTHHLQQSPMGFPQFSPQHPLSTLQQLSSPQQLPHGAVSLATAAASSQILPPQQPSTQNNTYTVASLSSQPLQTAISADHPEPAPLTVAEAKVAERVPEAPAGNEGFYIAFEQDTPKKLKPKLSSREERGGRESGVKTTPERKVEEKVDQTPPPPAASVHRVASPVTPGVGFLITDEQETTDSPDMERKKQKLLEMQLRRKEDSEKKRQKLEKEREKKREQERVKAELEDKRKAEEKAKRESIFEAYQKRKAERELAEEESKMGVVRRPKPVKSKRPKSQPAFMAALDDNSMSSESASGSTENLNHRAPFFVDCPDSTSGFTFGGSLTHRRPPSPEKYGRHHDLNFNAQQEYTGPKLFVKPNSKSNRQIISNAITQCCLAGAVNKDVKVKVLDELGKCDAKHFCILFRDGGQQYRGVYAYYPEREESFKLIGTGPKQLLSNMYDRFYKYNCGAKSFSEIRSTTHMSVSIDAVTIQNSFWQKKTQPKKAPVHMY